MPPSKLTKQTIVPQELAAQEPAAQEPAAQEPAAQPLFEAVVTRLVNPFTQEEFLPGTAVPATEDSWLECQVNAKLIRRCR